MSLDEHRIFTLLWKGFFYFCAVGRVRHLWSAQKDDGEGVGVPTVGESEPRESLSPRSSTGIDKFISSLYKQRETIRENLTHTSLKWKLLHTKDNILEGNYLKELSNEMDLSKSGINRLNSLKGRGAKIFSWFYPSSLMWEAHATLYDHPLESIAMSDINIHSAIFNIDTNTDTDTRTWTRTWNWTWN